MTDDDDDQKWTAKKKSRLHFVATPKSTNAKLYKTRVDGGENFSSNARIKETFVPQDSILPCALLVSHKNTLQKHTLFFPALEEKEEKEEERPRARMKRRVFWG